MTTEQTDIEQMEQRMVMLGLENVIERLTIEKRAAQQENAELRQQLADLREENAAYGEHNRRQQERINRLTATLTMLREMASEALEGQSQSQGQSQSRSQSQSQSQSQSRGGG